MASVLQELEVDVIGNSRCDNFLLGQRNPSNVCYKAQNAGTCAVSNAKIVSNGTNRPV